MLIGINGRLKAGKDTTFKIIRELYPHAERVSFADRLKRSAAAALGVTVNQLEEWKNDESGVKIQINKQDIYSFGDARINSAITQVELTVREYLQWYGTEAHRDVFGENFWVDAALPVDTSHDNRLLVVTDMRFPNEVQRVRDLGGVCVKVERNEGTDTKFGSHASEQNVDYLMDYFLSNHGTLDDLNKHVQKLFIEIPNLKKIALARRIYGEKDLNYANSS